MRKNTKRAASTLAMALLTSLTPAPASVISVTASGANPAAVQATVDQFRTDLGANNGVGGTFASGRREVNWDGVPDGFASPNAFPGNFFNANSPRGIEFNALGGGTGFQVSADSSNPTTTDVRFGNFDASYSSEFQTFSAERLFGVIGSSTLEVTFFIPGTSVQATVTGFGVIFTDIDAAGNGTSIEAFDLAGNSLGFLGAPSSPNGLSFAGLRVDGATERIARVVIRAGNTALGGSDAGAFDVVAMDDFIFGEPQAAVPEPGTLLLSGLGLTAAALWRKRLA